MFVEQVQWAVNAKVDYIIAETFGFLGEALLANEVIKATGLPSVVTIVIHQDGKTRDGFSPVDAMLALEKAGADVGGFNCYRGPTTMLPLLEEVAKVVKMPLAALPVPFRTTEKEPTFFCLTDEHVRVPFSLSCVSCALRALRAVCCVVLCSDLISLVGASSCPRAR
jgi:betaine-homocysteine S-methyltransferase